MVSEYFLCAERHDVKWRHVLEVEPSYEVEQYLKSRLPAAGKSPINDLSLIYSPGARLFLVDDIGVLLQGAVEYNGLYDVHIGFWDLVLRGREDMCHKMALRLAEDAGTAGVWTAIPLESRVTLAFAKRVGFVEQDRPGSIAVLTLIT